MNFVLVVFKTKELFNILIRSMEIVRVKTVRAFAWK
jgi:hypothetical protein